MVPVSAAAVVSPPLRRQRRWMPLVGRRQRLLGTGCVGGDGAEGLAGGEEVGAGQGGGEGWGPPVHDLEQDIILLLSSLGTYTEALWLSFRKIKTDGRTY